MPDIRELSALEIQHFQNCDRISISSYEMDEVILPVVGKSHNVKAIRVKVHGRNLKAVAQPLVVFVGKQMLRYLRIAPDEKSVEGILLHEPSPGDSVVVHLGDEDAARHPQTIDLKSIKRIH
jgi:hypothetical protein